MRLLFYFIFVTLIISSCRKDADIIPNNDAPYYGEIPTILLENYVNRLYIDLIGREPLDDEMQNDVQYLRDYDVTIASRDSLLYKIQSDTSFIEGDSSYKFAYYHRVYDMVKIRLLEGVSNSYVSGERNMWWNAYVQDSINNNYLQANKKLLEYHKLNNLLKSELEYYHHEIHISEMHRRMIYNPIYDQINMNTFNFVNAAFDNLLFRFPTQSEFDQSYTMIENNSAQIVLNSSGINKDDFCQIITNSREFYEGIVIWSYRALLARDPSTQEIDFLMQKFYLDQDFQWVQRQIMKTNEYAHF